MTPIAVGIVGAGTVARPHAAAIERLQEFTVCAVNDVDHEAASRFAADAGAVVASVDELIEMVDLVVVTAPHGLHADLAISAMKAGRHVLVEKPMATTTADCDRMIATAEEQGVLLWPGQQQRHYPGVRAAKEALAELGRPLLYIDRRDGDYRPERISRRWHFDRQLAGGGIAMNLGVHVVDRMLWLLDATPVAVQGACAVPDGLEVEAAAAGEVTLAGGPPASFTLTGTGSGDGHQTIVVCTGGQLVISDSGVAGRLAMPGPEQYERSFVGQYEAIARTLRYDASPSINPIEGRTAVAVIEALYASAHSGGTPARIG